mmetsp:Transcript_113203/g.283404  ORF Transcript_113203/g.283404 Transcript_113203/m.283404 type:complete len:223 (+) Transcript_113203:887-1555(+)
MVCCAIWRMYLRILTMSFMVGAREPLMSSKWSMNLGKVIVSHKTPSSSSKRMSAKSTKPVASMPASCKTLIDGASSRIEANSARETSESPSVSMRSRISAKRSRNAVPTISSVSMAETTRNTSQSTPMSIFITVRAAMTTKMRKPTYARPASARRATMSSEHSSRMAPRAKSVDMESKTLGKSRAPTSVPKVRCFMAMAKMYKRNIRKMNVNMTARKAAIIP